MRSLVAVCVIVCVVLAASFASAANPGQVSHDALSKMGLAGLQPLSDVEGTSVRGKCASVCGFSCASLGGGYAQNQYEASGKCPASGCSQSYVNLCCRTSCCAHVCSVVAGGCASATCH